MARYWRDAAFLLGAAFFSWLVFDAYSNPPSKNRYNPHKTYNCESAACEGFFLKPDVSANDKKTKAPNYLKEEQWRSERSDLAAQWETADRTRLAFRAAMLGVWLLIWTIFETKAAAKFAETALGDNRDNSRRELRAYIALQDCNLEVFEVGKPIEIMLCYHNYGATPAYNVGTKSNEGFNSVSSAEITDNSSRDIVAPNSGKCLSIGPENPLTQQELDSIESGESLFLVDFVCIYTDTFNETWSHRGRLYVGKRTVTRTKNDTLKTPGLYFRSEIELSEQEKGKYPKKWDKEEILSDKSE